MKTDFEDLLDGETHYFQPGVDFGPVAGNVVEWVETAVQPKGGLLPHESPEVNWLNIDPNAVTDKFYTVAEGWSAFALRLKALCQVFGIDAVIEQQNYRTADGAIIRTDYIFRVKDKEQI